ncbi:MAG: serine/threonine protein kinase, partial [Cyanobacteria bacterium]|nr:serine/threonine protein kinase [Cyanobacteriota bacterium]
MQIADRYTVTATLGKGAMGIVYKATDSLLDKVVALKVLSNFSETHFQRFQREAKVAAQLSHPNIVKVLDLGIVDNSPYMVMEYIEGRTLDALIKKGPVPIPVAIPILIQICLAMGHAHEKGVLHRDLKPSNVMLAKTETGEAAMLMDFGIAKIMSDEQSLTASGLTLGTPPYMAPEQIRAEAIDGRADIYAFGVLMFELLTGRLPFRGQNSIETMNLKLTETAPSLGQTTGTDFDTTLEQIVSTCLERNKQARFVSFAELASLLENFELHVSSVAIQSVERAKKKQQGSLRLALILSAISAIVIPVAIFSNSKQHDKNVRPVGRDPLDRADHLSDGEAKALERVNFEIVP